MSKKVSDEGGGKPPVPTRSVTTDLFCTPEGMAVLYEWMRQSGYGSYMPLVKSDGGVDPIGSSFNNGRADFVASIVREVCENGRADVIGNIMSKLFKKSEAKNIKGGK